jgi:hypothetical protein
MTPHETRPFLIWISHGRMARGDPGLPKISPRPAMLYPSTPSGRATTETALWHFIIYPLGHPMQYDAIEPHGILPCLIWFDSPKQLIVRRNAVIKRADWPKNVSWTDVWWANQMVKELGGPGSTRTPQCEVSLGLAMPPNSTPCGRPSSNRSNGRSGFGRLQGEFSISVSVSTKIRPMGGQPHGGHKAGQELAVHRA